MKVTGKHEFDSIPLVNSTDKLTGVTETTSAPTSASDSTAGYYRGYRWVDTTTGLTYVCIDDTAGAAVWTDYGSQINSINATLATITPQNELISGSVVYSGTGFVYNTTALSYRIGGSLYGAAAASPAFTLSAADPVNDRIDLVYVDTAGTVAVKTGTPAAAPARPTLDDPSTQLIITFITVAAGSSNPGTGFEDIYLENSEWTVGGTGTIVPNATSNPDTGTYHVDASLQANNSGTSQTLTFTRATDYTLPTDLSGASLNFKIKLDNVLSFPFEWRLVWKDASNNNVSQYITFEAVYVWGGGAAGTFYGLDLANTTSYQQCSIPLSSFNISTTTVRSLQIQFRRFGTFSFGVQSQTYNFDIDEVKVEEGGTTPETNQYVQGTGETDYVARWTSANELGKGIIKDNGSRLGINDDPQTNSAGALALIKADTGNTGLYLYNNGVSSVNSRYTGYRAYIEESNLSNIGFFGSAVEATETNAGVVGQAVSYEVSGVGVGVYGYFGSFGDIKDTVDFTGKQGVGIAGTTVAEGEIGVLGMVESSQGQDSIEQYAFWGQVQLTGSTTSAKNQAYVYYSKGVNGNGTGNHSINTAYHIYLEGHSSTVNTQAYGIYQAGTSDENFFAGDTTIGQLKFDASQNVGVSQDNYVLTYNNASGKISLEPSAGGISGSGITNRVPYFTGATQVTANDTFQYNGSTVAVGGNTNNSKMILGISTSVQTGVAGFNTHTGSGVKYGIEGQSYGANGTNIGGAFYATGATNNYSVRLDDGTEGLHRLLVSNTANGDANWATKLTWDDTNGRLDVDLAGTTVRRKISLYETADNDYQYAGFGLETNKFISSLSQDQAAFTWECGLTSTTAKDMMVLQSITGSGQRAYLDVYGQVRSVYDSNNIYTPTAAFQIDCNYGNSFQISLSSATIDIQVGFLNARAGSTYFLKIVQGSSGVNVLFPTAVKFPGGTSPTISTTSGAIDTIVLFFDGSNYYANFAQDYQ